MDVAVLERQLLLKIFHWAADLADAAEDKRAYVGLKESVAAYRNFKRLVLDAEKAARASNYANATGGI